MEVKDSRTQGRCREAASERRARQRRGSMNKNRMRGAVCRASGRTIAKPISIKNTQRESGDRASKAIELTSGDLSGVLMNQDWSTRKGRERRAEVSRGRSSPIQRDKRQGRFPRSPRRLVARIKARTVWSGE